MPVASSLTRRLRDASSGGAGVEVRWTPSALRDLDSSGEYIKERKERAALRIGRRLEEAVLELTTFPNLGRPGRLRGTREVVVSGTPFVVIYRVRLDQVQVLRILHHARKWR
jgi:toxin ParE1/3/4